MASYDGTNKSSAGCAQHLPYWEINTPYTRELYNEAMAEASPEAVKFCNPDGYNGPEIEVDASTLTEDQWQARRADHLGGSDISAIFGANKFKTNLDLFYAKTGKQPIVPEEETSQSRLNKLWGHISEEYVDAWLSERYPYNDIITDTNIYSMPGKPYITANIDRMMRKPDGSYCLVEIKTTSSFNKAEWENVSKSRCYVERQERLRPQRNSCSFVQTRHFCVPRLQTRVCDKHPQHDAGYCVRCYLLPQLQTAGACHQRSSQGRVRFSEICRHYDDDEGWQQSHLHRLSWCQQHHGGV